MHCQIAASIHNGRLAGGLIFRGEIRYKEWGAFFNE
jgi:hypothetical protein